MKIVFLVHLLPNKYLSVHTENLSVSEINPEINYQNIFNIDKEKKYKEIIHIEKYSDTQQITINRSLEHSVYTPASEFLREYKSNKEKIAHLKRCTQCLLPETFPFIEFNTHGVCNKCLEYEKQKIKGAQALEEIVEKYRRNNGEPDCIVAFSGGRDSSYSLHYIKKVLGLTPLVYSYDWGMITDLARRNQARMCGKLGVEHILVSADIRHKRKNIHKNVSAWLKSPHLGTIPLFMAGDKQYFYFARKAEKAKPFGFAYYGREPF